MDGAEDYFDTSLPSRNHLISLFGPHYKEASERLKKASRYGEVLRWNTRSGSVLFVPPPRPLLIPPKTPEELLLPGVLPHPPVKGIFVIDGEEVNDAELEGLWNRRGKYIRGVFRSRTRRYFSYLFLSPGEVLIPFLLSSSDPPIDPDVIPAVHEAVYYKKGAAAYLLKASFATGPLGAPLFTRFLMELGQAFENILSGGDREGEIKRLIERVVNPSLNGLLSILKEEIERSPKRTDLPREGIAGKIMLLKGGGMVTSQDVGKWVGALSSIVRDVMSSLSELPLPGDLTRMHQHLRRAFRNSQAMKSSVRLLKVFQETPRFLLLTNLRFENISLEKGVVRYLSDPLRPSLVEEPLFSSPPPAHLAPILNSLSRLSLVSFRREAMGRLKGNFERPVALNRARFMLSTLPRRIYADVGETSPIYHLKFSSEHGYITEGLHRYVEAYLVEWLQRMYSNAGYTIPGANLQQSLYLFALMRQLYELKERIDEGQLSVNYLSDALTVVVRNLNKYETLYRGRGKLNAGGN